MIIVGYVGYNTTLREGLQYREFSKISNTLIKGSKNNIEDFLDPICQARYPFSHYCKIGADKPPTIAIIGDSHANHFFYGLSRQYELLGENLLNLGLPACIPLVDVNSVGYWSTDTCISVNRKIFEKVVNDKSIHTVILASQWHNQIVGTHFYKNSPQKNNQLESPLFPIDTPSNKIFEKQLQKTINYLIAHQKKIILIKQIPELDFDPIGCELSKLRGLFVKARNCVSNAQEVKAYLDEYENFFDEVVSANPKIKVWDPKTFFCNENDCIASLNGQLLYDGDYHLSKLGSSFFAKEIFSK